MLAAEKRENHGERHRGGGPGSGRILGERLAHALAPAEARERCDARSGKRDQAEHFGLRLGAQEKRAVRGDDGDTGEPRKGRPRIGGPVRHLHTLSALFSAIRPVGRHAISAITAAKANTSL